MGSLCAKPLFLMETEYSFFWMFADFLHLPDSGFCGELHKLVVSRWNCTKSTLGRSSDDSVVCGWCVNDEQPIILFAIFRHSPMVIRSIVIFTTGASCLLKPTSAQSRLKLLFVYSLFWESLQEENVAKAFIIYQHPRHFGSSKCLSRLPQHPSVEILLHACLSFQMWWALHT